MAKVLFAKVKHYMINGNVYSGKDAKGGSQGEDFGGRLQELDIFPITKCGIIGTQFHMSGINI